MDYILDLWYLLAILCACGATVGAIMLFWAVAEWVADEWRRFRRGCQRRARLRARARLYRAGMKKKAAVRRV